MTSNGFNKYSGHYYGDIVRQLFVAAGVIMVLTLPFYKYILPVPSLIAVLAIIIVDVAAGLTNPRQAWVMKLDLGISLIAATVFEYHAVTGYASQLDPLFWITQGLAVIFFFALYFSIKSTRGAFLQGK
ncbi:MAG: hypothetical protein AAB367_00645 [Patescibacteria group bacterium]